MLTEGETRETVLLAQEFIDNSRARVLTALMSNQVLPLAIALISIVVDLYKLPGRIGTVHRLR